MQNILREDKTITVLGIEKLTCGFFWLTRVKRLKNTDVRNFYQSNKTSVTVSLQHIINIQRNEI